MYVLYKNTISSEITRSQFLLTPLCTLIILVADCKFSVGPWLARLNKTNLRMCKNQKYVSPVVQSSVPVFQSK